MSRTDFIRQAVTKYLEPFRAAIHCVAHGTLVTTLERTYVLGRAHSLVINGGLPLELRSSPPVTLSGGQVFEIVRDDVPQDRRYRVHPVKYFYVFSTADRQELLNFQWTPEATRPGERTFPHLHIGRGLLAGRAAIFPETFHKKHVPTGHVPFASIIRFAIEELGVPPLRNDWSAVLGHGQPASERALSPEG